MSKNSHIIGSIFAILILGASPVAYGDDRISGTNFYAAYYDGHYGQIADGYWGRHGKYFWYKDQAGNWHQDDGTHFQKESAPGFVLIHGSGVQRSH